MVGGREVVVGDDGRKSAIGSPRHLVVRSSRYMYIRPHCAGLQSYSIILHMYQMKILEGVFQALREGQAIIRKKAHIKPEEE